MIEAELSRSVVRWCPGATGATAAAKLSGGASQETWRFDIVHPNGNIGAILRRSPKGYGAAPTRAAGLAAERGVRFGVMGGAGSLLIAPDGPRLVDTPGLHRPRTLLGKRLNDLVRDTYSQVDVIGLCIPADEAIGSFGSYVATRFGNKSVAVSRFTSVMYRTLRKNFCTKKANREI